ncbi:MAG: hypothetical protein DRP09_19185 [Candidatus Thorarchaeota archaeon]|nr:MAG: hypothetical protein DRP09_19185 [Candidatus Thorarchaeota archaeon]
MSVLADRIRSLSAEVLKNTRSLNLNSVRGSRGVPLRLSHPSGCSIKFDRGDIYFRATEHYFDNHITLTGEGGGDEETYPCIFMENKDYDNDRHLFVSLNNSGYFILGNGSNDIGLACDLNCQMMKITNLPEPTDNYDAANKKYVDDAVGSGGVSDHGELTGLGDDDHTQYLLADGSRFVSGNLSPAADSTYNLGAGNWRWYKLYSDAIDTGTVITDNISVTDGIYVTEHEIKYITDMRAYLSSGITCRNSSGTHVCSLAGGDFALYCLKDLRMKDDTKIDMYDDCYIQKNSSTNDLELHVASGCKVKIVVG